MGKADFAVENLPTGLLVKKNIKNHFSKFGTVKSVTLNKSRRRCQVVFASEMDAKKASFGTSWNGHRLNIIYAQQSNNSQVISYEDVDMDYSSGDCDYFGVEDSPKKKSKKRENIFKQDNSSRVDQEKIKKIDEWGSNADFKQSIANTYQDKLSVLEDRDKFIRSKLVAETSIKSPIKGTCPDMCPEKERLLREVNCLFSIYEGTISNNEMHVVPELLVKEYSRSSADQDEPLQHELRPEPVLTMTMAYMINNIIPKYDDTSDNLGEWYHFCWDRLRGIRKDIIQQQLCDLNTVTIVEQCARFHICCYDLFYGKEASIFDQKINTENLVNCLQMLSDMYDDLGKKNISCENEAEFRSYLVLLQLDMGDIVWMFKKFNPKIKKSPKIQEVIAIFNAFRNNLFSNFFKFTAKTSYLNSCILLRYFNIVRIQTWNILVKSICPQNKKVGLPLSILRPLLKFDTLEDAASFVTEAGFSINDCNEIIVSKMSSGLRHNKQNTFFSSTWEIVTDKRIPLARAMVGENSKIPEYVRQPVHDSFSEFHKLNTDALLAIDQREKVKDIQNLQQLASEEGSSGEENITEKGEDFEKKKIKLSPLKSGNLVDNAFATKLAALSKSDNFFSFQNHPKDYVIDNQPQNVPEKSPFAVSATSNSSTSSEKADKNASFGIFKQNSFAQYEQKSPPRRIPQLVPLKIVAPLSPLRMGPRKSPPKMIQPASPAPQIVLTTKPKKRVSFSERPQSFLMESNDQTGKENIQPIIDRSNDSIKIITENLSREIEKFEKIRLRVYQTQLYFEKPDAKFRETGKEYRKLRKTVKKNIKKHYARKYSRIWRQKVKKLKMSHDDIPIITNLSVDQHLTIWGSVPNYAQTDKFIDRCENLKKSKLKISEILDDSSIKMVSILPEICEHIAENVVKMRIKKKMKLYDSPICMKIHISLPDATDPSFTQFCLKVKELCAGMFHTSDNPTLGSVQSTITRNNIKVLSIINATNASEQVSNEGLNGLAFVITSKYESINNGVDRLKNIVERSNSGAFPLCFLLLDSELPFEYAEYANTLKRKCIITDYTSYKWISFNCVLKCAMYCCINVAFIPAIRIQKLSQLMENYVPLFFTGLASNIHIIKGTYATDCPNTYIDIYNEFIEAICEALINARDYLKLDAQFVKYLVESENQIISNFEKPQAIADILREKYLIPRFAVWPPISTKKLLSILERYCKQLEANSLFGNIVRIINPLEEESMEDISCRTDWLTVVELLANRNAEKVREEEEPIFAQEVPYACYSERVLDKYIHEAWYV